MKVKIFTEGGSTIGYGHISRCLSLYEEIRDRGFEVDFIINGHLNNAKLMDNIDYININWLSSSFINKTINNEDYCIVDSYLADREICEVISYKAKRTLFIDDIGRLNYPRGIVVNPSLNTDNINYSNNTKNTYLLGQKYIILRTPFIKDHTKQIKKTVSHVLVTMGGSDIRNLTPKILKHISIRYPNITFSIITTSSYKNLKMIDEASESLDNVKLYKDINGELMRDLMLEADFAITAAGQTVYELLAINTPFIAIKVSDNQSNNIDGLAKTNQYLPIIDSINPNLLKILNKRFIEMFEYKVRLIISNNTKYKVGKLGRKRIIDNLIKTSILEKDIFLRKVSADDVNQIFELSNKEYVRRYSKNKDKIKWEDHLQWFHNTMNNHNYVFYAVTNAINEFLGQIRFEIKEEKAVVSLSLSKSIMGNGLSDCLLRNGIDKLFSERKDIYKIIAFVNKDNIASKKLFDKVGFSFEEENYEFITYSFRKGI